MEIINKTQLPIFDLHSDLLSYLSGNIKRTPFDREVRCSIPQMQAGGVKVQTLAVFSETSKDSSLKGKKQLEIFKSLINLYPDHFKHLKHSPPPDMSSKTINIIAAIENASCICGEDEDLEAKLTEITRFQKKAGKLLYVSLTWNGENRFGGGALTKAGLKNDGKRLVGYLSEKKIALDLSHASDYLAFDLLNYIDKERLPITIIASHSNMRSIANYPRNLPNDLASEIIRRKGIIGLNLIRYLLGKESLDSIARHVECLLRLNGEVGLSFGADFFYNGDEPDASRKPIEDLFYPEFGDSSCYPIVVSRLESCLGLTKETLENICYKNFMRCFFS